MWCPSASLLILARFEALQKRAPEPRPRRAPGAPSYAREGSAPGAGADPEAVALDMPKKQVENRLYYVRQKLKKMM